MGFWKALLLAGLASGAAVQRDTAGDAKLTDCPGYSASNVKITDSGLTAELTLAGKACNAYGDDVKDLVLEVTYETDNRLHVKIQDKGNQVYQVPDVIFPRPTETSSAKGANLKFDYTEKPFSFKVSRADGEVLFDTSAASLVFESQYLRLRTSLPADPYLYGLGEHSDPFRLNTTNYIRTIWNQDSYGIPTGANLYGAHPIYVEQRKSGAHGVFLLNSNGMDIMINSDAGGQYLEYNTLGGVLDFWFLSGPSPTQVTQQYGEIAGHPAIQPYWGLGFHNCRYGYRDAFDVAEAVYNYSQASIPLETMWTDIDYMDRRRTFTFDPERFSLDKLQALVSHLHKNDQHYIVMVDPAVYHEDNAAVERGKELNIFLKRDNGSDWLGVVWPGVTVFPDWFSANITEFWNGQFTSFFDKDTGIDIDALWIDMNEPSNFPCNFPCDDPFKAAIGFPPPAPPVRQPPRPLPGWPCALQPAGTGCKDTKREVLEISAKQETSPVAEMKRNPLLTPETRAEGSGDRKGLPGRDLLYPKYSIHNKAAWRDDWNGDKGGISNHTVNTNLKHQNGLTMYDTHNMYGSMMSIASREAMEARRPGLRPLIITRSTFAGAGSKVGHWLGDNLANWDKYRASVRTLLAFTSIYQFNMVGSDVCGFGGNTNEALCARWAMLGAFSTFYRNHNDLDSIPQEFYRWPEVAAAARKAIDIRYRLLDYIYTAMYQASVDGTPAIQPTFYLYPKDQAAWSLDLQYFYGSGVLVAPVTQEGANSVDVYLPDDTFYDWYTHEPIQGGAKTHSFVNQSLTDIPLLIRSGVILPLRETSAMTTTELRKRDFELIVALDKSGKAKGQLYVDDGVSIKQAGYTLLDFSFEHGVLHVSGVYGYPLDVAIKKVTVLTQCKRNTVKTTHAAGGEVKKTSRTYEVDISLNKESTTTIAK